MLIATRAGHPIVLASHSDVDELLALTRIIASGYRADALCLVTECLVPQLPQELHAAGGLASRADPNWVMECQVVVTVGRDGEECASAQPFEVADDGTYWSPDLAEIEVSRFRAVLRRAFVSTSTEPRLEVPTVPSESDKVRFLDPTRGRTYLDIRLTRLLDGRLTIDHPGGGAMVIAHDAAAAAAMRTEGLLAGQYRVYRAA